ncbi:MAG: GntR family transcriptional regulator [Pirellulales bacterium]|nr:GntR family transcriptional regulator [Pirellulales bacterium]
MATWRRFIQDDLRARIRVGEEVVDILTLQALAAHYQVSLTPVRLAVGDLIEEGFLKKLSNGRLTVNRDAVGSNVGQDASRPDLPEDLPRKIKDDLVVLSLRGEAVFLREAETAERYETSGTVIRQVFHRLAGSGLIEHIPRRGWRLVPFSQEKLEDYTHVRKMLEVEAMRLAWPHLEDDDLRVMLNANRVPDNQNEEPFVDNGIHAYLIEKADNFFISDFFARHQNRFDPVFAWEATDRQAAIDTALQHRAILEALLARDPSRAEEALLEHLDYGHTALRNVLWSSTEHEIDAIVRGGE